MAYVLILLAADLASRVALLQNSSGRLLEPADPLPEKGNFASATIPRTINAQKRIMKIPPNPMSVAFTRPAWEMVLAPKDGRVTIDTVIYKRQ